MGRRGLDQPLHTFKEYVDTPRPWLRIAKHAPALEQLDKSKRSSGRISLDAQEALTWLDAVTSQDQPSASRVNIQGPDDRFTSWAEVEKYLLPDTYLSQNGNDDHEVSGLPHDLSNRTKLQDGEDHTSLSSSSSLPKDPTSPQSVDSSVASNVANPERNSDRSVSPAASKSGMSDRERNTDSNAAQANAQSRVPRFLQPLLNYVLWRMHHCQNSSQIANPFILVTNDIVTTSCAQKFGVRVKHVEQLREAIKREERDFKNRQQLVQKENGLSSPKQVQMQLPETKSEEAKGNDDDQDSEEEEILFKSRRPAAPKQTPPQKPQQLDPNSFKRTPPAGPRGGLSPRTQRGRAKPSNVNTRLSPVSQPDKPIDPNSFSRPSPHTQTLLGGPRKKLWQPT